MRMNKTKVPNRWNTNTKLLLLIGILALVLVVILCIALGSAAPDPGVSTPPVTGGNVTTAPTGATTQPSTGNPTQLAVTEPSEGSLVVLDKHYTFRGTSDPNESLTINGQEVTRSADGSFQLTVELSSGSNTFQVSHKGTTLEYTIEYRYVVQSFAPQGEQTYNSGALVMFEVFARKGSTVTAQFNGTTVTLKEHLIQEGNGAAEGFARFVGEYRLTNTNTQDLDLGAVTYTATYGGITEVYTSGKIICQKTNQILASDPSVTPTTGGYINVGSGYIVEVTTYTAETFDGKTKDDYSHPTNNYLPQGTVDYCPTTIVQNGNLKYVVLRSGQRVYLQKKDNLTGKQLAVVDRYIGQLPDHNEIKVSSVTDTGKHLVLTLDTLWKAPFYFDLLPQSYYYPNGGSDRNYSVTACTAEYVEIRFCYATVFSGQVQLPENNLFSSAEVINNGPDHTLRLYLKKVGAFYGWDAYYNDAGQLCLKFLKPATVSKADNAYGVDLSGVTVMIDVGHGGVDGGATLRDENGVDLREPNGDYIDEAAQNLKLAMKVKAELESLGATVILNRTGDTTLYVDERLQMLKEASPDICLAIHHNAVGGYPNINGLETYYYSPFSQAAAKEIYQANVGNTVYKNNRLDWHYYYTARQTVCPVVLTENGYTTSPYDVSHMLSDDSVQQKANALAKGIAQYFLKISG